MEVYASPVLTVPPTTRREFCSAADLCEEDPVVRVDSPASQWAAAAVLQPPGQGSPGQGAHSSVGQSDPAIQAVSDGGGRNSHYLIMSRVHLKHRQTWRHTVHFSCSM